MHDKDPPHRREPDDEVPQLPELEVVHRQELDRVRHLRELEPEPEQLDPDPDPEPELQPELELDPPIKF